MIHELILHKYNFRAKFLSVITHGNIYKSKNKTRKAQEREREREREREIERESSGDEISECS